MILGGVARAGLRRALHVPDVPSVPPGQLLELPGRGRTFVLDVPGPAPEAPVVVLLHALSCTAYLSWYPVLSSLSEHYRVVALDQRWHGRGIRSAAVQPRGLRRRRGRPAGRPRRRALHPGRYSMGGAVAQLVWRRHPQRTEGLVLCATARNFRGKRRERVLFPLVTTALQPLSGYARTRAERVAAGLPEVPSCDSADPLWGQVRVPQHQRMVGARRPHRLGSFNSAPWIGEVDVPTAVVVTGKDHTIPERRQRRLAAAIPGSTVIDVEGGHAALVLGADRFRPALLAALSTVHGTDAHAEAG